MKVVKHIILFCISTMLCYSVFSQSESRRNEHCLGLHVGVINGGGFSYRFSYNKVGLQLTGFVFNTRKQELVRSLGGSVFYTFKHNKDHDLFVFAGGFIGTSERRSETAMNLPFEKRYRETTSLGGGVGYKTKIGDDFKFTLQVGPNYLYFRQKKRLSFSIGTGFYYCI